jgi:tetratricopeptide (TPR) repeat protein
MKKCLLYGNCQTEPLKNFLASNVEFNSIYQSVWVKRVHLMSVEHVPELEELITDIDLFIYQNVSDNYQGINQLSTNYLRSRLKPSCQAIAIPGAYFTGYNPELIYLKDKDGNKIKSELGDYHDFNLVALFYQGKQISEVVDFIQKDDFYSSQYILGNLEDTLGELSRREVYTDINLSQFIQKYYRQLRLFHTINHPTSVIINYLGNEILKKLGFSYQQEEELFGAKGEEVLDTTSFPIYSSTAKILDLDFVITNNYRLKNVFFPQREAIEKFFKFYDKNFDLVESNFLKYKKKYSSNLTSIKSKQELNLSINSEKATWAIKLLDIAQEYQKQNQLEKAIVLCKASLELNQINVRGWRDLGTLYQLQENYQQAIKCYKKVIEMQPNQGENYIRLAKILELQGDSKEAINCYQQAIKLNSKQPAWVYRSLGNLLSEIEREDEAICAYQKAAELKPNSPAILYVNLGNALRKQKRFQEAVNSYIKAMKINPNLKTKLPVEVFSF